MALRFDPPPNWPAMPEGWQPGPGWRPNPSWGPPPYGWQLWREDVVRPPAGKGVAYLSTWVAVYSALFAVGLLITFLGIRVGRPDVGALIGFSPAGAAGPVHKFLVGRRTHRSSGEVALEAGFNKPWWVVLLVSGTLYFVALQAAGVVSGLVLASNGFGAESLGVVLDVATILVTLAVFPPLGYWVGLRVDKMSAYFLPPLIGLLGQAGGILLSVAVLSNGGPEYEPILLSINAMSVAIGLSFGVIMGVVAGIPFVFVGRENRASQYVAWMAKKTDRVRRQRESQSGRIRHDVG